MYLIKHNETKQQLLSVLEWAEMLNEDCIITAQEDNLVLIIDEEIIAYLFHKDGHIYKFEVKEEYRNKGYGSKLIKFYLDFAKSYNLPLVTLNAIDECSQKFYLKHGFKIVNNDAMKIINTEETTFVFH